jgi:putative ABC transport system permease protein
VGSGSEARQASVIFADHHYFPLLGVRAQIGRVFGAADDQPPAGREVVVLSDPYWRGAFGGDPNVLGRDLRIGA